MCVGSPPPSRRAPAADGDIMKHSLATVPSSAFLASGSRLAAGAAAWCSLHCALTPFLVVAAPALALSEGVERAVWAGTVVPGAMMLLPGPARRNAVVMLTFGGGAALWAAPSRVGSSRCPRP